MIKLMVLLMSCVLSLVGCSPGIISANPRSIVIQNGEIHNESEVYRIANAHCQSYGRFAVLRPQSTRSGSTFECVE